MRALSVSTIALLTAALSFGQSTWKELQFGTSLAAMRTEAGKRGWTLESGKDGWIIQPVWTLTTAATSISFPFKPTLMFSSKDELERVHLVLQTENVLGRDSQPLSAAALTLVSAATLSQQLSGKYGPPVSKNGLCEAVTSSNLLSVSGFNMAQCKAMWRGTGQTITLEWHYFEFNKKLILWIDYEATGSGGL